ncbi:HAD family acid phosphatase [Legionella dresdenensis]|uniref:HAD family acid phosphatase n=1 Tax=Legionella dresdenensis TaxID=450200 RepID=A0ABV8CGW7_9GAMM
MKAISKLLSLLVIPFVLLNHTAFAEPANLSLLTHEVQNYHDSGQYDRELAAVIKRARHYIDKQATLNQQSKHPKKLALVLDIDETSLSNYCYMQKRGFYPTREQLQAEMSAADAPAIKPMLALYKEAMKHGVKVFFVTGRPVSVLEATKTNLVRAGYTNWAGLYLKPDNYHARSIIPFKASSRALISKQGYTIVATIGDQYSDLMGGYAQKEFKLPNPYYFLP